AGVTDPATIQAFGPDNVLEGNASPAVTIWVRGDDWFGQGGSPPRRGRATPAPSAWSRTTTGGGVPCRPPTPWSTRPPASSPPSLEVGGTLTKTGSIEVTAGSGGDRSITGDLVNEGTIDVAADAHLDVYGNSDAGPRLTQAGGALDAGGGLLLHGGLFDLEGG